jgi:hypothetical protein
LSIVAVGYLVAAAGLNSPSTTPGVNEIAATVHVH